MVCVGVYVCLCVCLILCLSGLRFFVDRVFAAPLPRAALPPLLDPLPPLLDPLPPLLAPRLGELAVLVTEVTLLSFKASAMIKPPLKHKTTIAKMSS